MSILCASLLAALAACGENPPPVRGTPPASAPAVEKPDFTRVVGKWRRPDGGYLLEIRGVAEDGKLQAGYFNPNPIHVSQAWCKRSEDGRLAVFVELRDKGYPGATYHLQYRGGIDTLAGLYTQPAQQQTFEVEFARER